MSLGFARDPKLVEGAPSNVSMCYPLDREIDILIRGETRRTSARLVGDVLRQAGVEPGEPIPVLSPCQKMVTECLVLSQNGGCSWLPVALFEVIRE